MKKEALAQVFSCEFGEISKNIFLPEHIRWLLLIFVVEFVEILFCSKPMIVRKRLSMIRAFLLFGLIFQC